MSEVLGGVERVMQIFIFCTSKVPTFGRPAGLTLSGASLSGRPVCGEAVSHSAPSLRLAG